jgi:hypothetical protein
MKRSQRPVVSVRRGDGADNAHFIKSTGHRPRRNRQLVGFEEFGDVVGRRLRCEPDQGKGAYAGTSGRRRNGLESRNAQHPCRGGGTALELSGLPPDVEEHLADQVFRRRFCAPASVQTGTREHGAARTAPAWRADRRLRFARSELRPKSFASQNNGSCMGRLRGRRGSSRTQRIRMRLPAPGGLTASFPFSHAIGQAQAANPGI